MSSLSPSKVTIVITRPVPIEMIPLEQTQLYTNIALTTVIQRFPNVGYVFKTLEIYPNDTNTTFHYKFEKQLEEIPPQQQQ